MNKLFTILGSCYVVFAIVIAMDSLETNDAGDQVVAKASQFNPFSYKQAEDANPRTNYYLTIWSLCRGCSPCEKLKAQVATMEAAGYNIIVKNPPAPRWVQSFPSTVVRKGSHDGEQIGYIDGNFTLEDLDEKLNIKDTPVPEDENGTEEIPDYDIFRP